MTTSIQRLTFTTGSTIAVAVISLLLLNVAFTSASGKNYIGKVCTVDIECGTNEFCNIPKIIQPPCKSGYCACKPCFINNTATTSCMPVHVERPCDLACHNKTMPADDCDDWCEDSPPHKLLSPNTHCQHFTRGKRSRRVICDSCYESRNRQCVPKVNLGNGAVCTDDCVCSSNLKCNGRCMCLTTNERWDPVALTCVRRELDDLCIYDSDCDVEPDDDHFGHIYRGLACVNGRCHCAANFTSTEVTYLDDNSAIITRRICVANGAASKLTERERCTFRSPYDGRFSTAKICASGLLCMSCGDSNPTKICRAIGKDATNGSWSPYRCQNASPSEMLLDPMAYGKFGHACGRDQHCGNKEICYKTSVTPPCLEGSCQCQACHAPGPERVCLPKLNAPCSNRKGIEIYPEHAECKDGTVSCSVYYRESEAKQCVPDAARYAMPGDDCTSTANCFGVLVCSASVVTSPSMNKQSRQCGCRTGDNQRWDSTLKKCVAPRLGDYCDFDSDCNSIYLLPPTAKQRICQGNRCTCDPDHIAYKGECYARNEQVNCFRCPEDIKQNNSTCRTAYVIEQNPPEETETCLNQLATSLYKIENPSPKTPNCRPQNEIESNYKVGRPCLSNSECGVNEVCNRDSFMPVCEFGRCYCQHGHYVGPNNTCSPLVLMRPGQMCFNSPNEVYHQTERDVVHSLTPLRCDNGIVRCNACYRFEAHRNICVRNEEPAKIEGESCSTSCECLGDGAMVCDADRRCSCRSPSELFDETTKTCRPREIWTPCYKGSNCNKSGYTLDGGTCANGFCTCRQQYMPTFTGFYDGLNITSKQICILSQAKPYLNKRLGSSCTPDPVQNSGTYSMLHGGVCGTGFVCINCDGDPDPVPTRGICRKFADGRVPSDAPSREECVINLIRESSLGRATSHLHQLSSVPTFSLAMLLSFFMR